MVRPCEKMLASLVCKVIGLRTCRLAGLLRPRLEQHAMSSHPAGCNLVLDSSLEP